MKRTLLCLGILIASILVSRGNLLAQSATDGAISGTVRDNAGAIISGASVLSHNLETGADRVQTTDAEGFYRIPQLPPGVYRVTIFASGFAKSEFENQIVSVGMVTEISPHMAVVIDDEALSREKIIRLRRKF